MKFDNYALLVNAAKKIPLKSDEIIFLIDLLETDVLMRKSEQIDFSNQELHTYPYGIFDADIDVAFVFLEGLVLTNSTDDTVISDIVNSLKSKNLIYVSNVLEKEVVALNWGTLDVE